MGGDDYKNVLVELEARQKKRKKKSPKKVKKANQRCKPKKVVTAEILTVTFKGDHLDKKKRKLLRPSSKIKIDVLTDDGKSWQKNYESPYGESAGRFQKPEWDSSRGGNSDCHPVSYTKSKKVKVDVKIKVEVKPKGQSTKITGIKGDSNYDSLKFDKKIKKTTKSASITIKGIEAVDSLYDAVCRYEETITWQICADGKWIDIGTTGTHNVYVTYDQPGGKMDENFGEKGDVQDVTEARLRFAIDKAYDTGKKDEKECVDAIFVGLSAGYFLGRRWKSKGNDTGVLPKPSLHHYLWLCNAIWARGECHNIAAGFALACKILGVKGKFEVGYVYPWPSRKDTHPLYPKDSKAMQGKYCKQYTRKHGALHGGTEKLVFLDGRNKANNFEGVTKYENALYAIGDQCFDLSRDPHKNASTYFMMRQGSLGQKLIILDRKKGCMRLAFSRYRIVMGKRQSLGGCADPYPGKVASSKAGAWKGTFKWED